MNTTTPDGYAVNEQGAWMVDGVVQTQQVNAVQTPSKLRDDSIKTSQLEKFQYFLYTPKNATENLPLIVYLHGHGLGEKMNDLRNEPLFAAFREEAESKSPAYILAPLLPPELDLGSKGMWPGIDPSIMELIDYIAREYKIDRKRISIAGLSMGADSAIQLIAAHPDVFSCMIGVVPFHYKCPIAKWEAEWGEKFKSVPTWLFVEDEGEAKRNAQAAVNGIISAGGQAWLEIPKNSNHASAKIKAYSALKSGQNNGYEWMISVSK